jgi:hypothetical protein
LQVFHPGYLRGEKVLPDGRLGTITLPAGDVTRDNRIDASDLSFVSEHYGSSDPMADLNADGTVDELDLSLVEGNLNRGGVVSNWQ